MIGYVYVLKDRATNNVVYVGSTTKPINERLNSHISVSKVSNQPIHIYLRGLKIKPIIEVYLEVEYETVKTLRDKEKEVIKDFCERGIPLYNRQGSVLKLEAKGEFVNVGMKSIRVSCIVAEKIRNHIKKTKQTFSGFYDLAASEKIKSDKLTEKILKNESSNE